MSKIKILMIGPDSQGGITSVIKMYLKNGLDEAEFLPSYTGGNVFKLFAYYSFFLLQYFFKLCNKKIKIIHIHSASKGSFFRKSLCVFLAKLFNKKVIFHIHGSYFCTFFERSPNFIKNIISSTLKRSDIVIAIYSKWGKQLLEIEKEINIKVLYNPTVLQNKKNISNKLTNVLFLGRLTERKGIYDVVEATKHLKNKNIIINMYGDGDAEKLQKEISPNNLDNIVKIGGWIDGKNIEKAYNEADILILPSYSECMPMSILEAMAAGLPIIASNVGGIPEAVIDGKNGYLIEPGDYKALAEKIDHLSINEFSREKMGLKSFEMARNTFDIKIILNNLRNCYKELLD